MGHSIHFLERLERIAGARLALALRLYYDRELVQHVLRVVPLPPGLDRVAVSLGHLREGPFVILTTTGQFVTCLGPGMRTRRLVISHDRLLAAIEGLERLRARQAAPTRQAA